VAQDLAKGDVGGAVVDTVKTGVNVVKDGVETVGNVAKDAVETLGKALPWNW
jgi:hypothetical protein